MSTNRRRGQRMTPRERAEAQAAFLASLRRVGSIRLAAEAAGVDRGMVWRWQRDDPDFAALYTDALADANDVIREEIFRRGVDGYTEQHLLPNGRVVDVHKYSDQMLRLLSQRMPEFHERVDVTSGDKPLGYPYERILEDEAASALVCQLAERLAAPGFDAGGSGADSE